ncbi:hypothetical protein CFP56_033229 [Quercus suber]|uniref:Uncharacterized protein n=1 Tax=Quercus suber TaxID=58331 RepID=A0AAW0MA97_QUESU
MVQREKDTFVIARRKKGYGCFASKWGISTSTTFYTNWELFSQGDYNTKVRIKEGSPILKKKVGFEEGSHFS